jgi:chemotaxis protein methyltransferase CheR
MNDMPEPDLQNLEIDLVLEGLLRRYGYDFRHYARATLKRRLEKRCQAAGLSHIIELLPALLRDRTFVERLLHDMSVVVTEMFRDPDFFQAVRATVVPQLRTWPYLKVWHAGCATGEELYSMAILFEEEDLYERTRFYATDVNHQALATAREGIYPLDKMEKFARNYRHAGGTASFSSYCLARYQSAMLQPQLRRRVTFASHNLATDGVFGDMNLIVCRNVLIYFDRTLQNRVLELFRDSLCHLGFLCLGNRETLEFSSVAEQFEIVDRRQRIYRKLSA